MLLHEHVYSLCHLEYRSHYTNTCSQDRGRCSDASIIFASLLLMFDLHYQDDPCSPLFSMCLTRQDIDDALSVHLLANGNYEIGVHIADVTGRECTADVSG